MSRRGTRGVWQSKSADSRRALRKKLWQENDGLCGICGFAVTLENMTVDHILSRYLQGTDTWSNLQPAHDECNILKGAWGLANVS